MYFFFSTRDVTLTYFFLFVLKFILSSLPNIEGCPTMQNIEALLAKEMHAVHPAQSTQAWSKNPKMMRVKMDNLIVLE